MIKIVNARFQGSTLIFFVSHFKTPSIGPALETALRSSTLPTVLSVVHFFQRLRLVLLSQRISSEMKFLSLFHFLKVFVFVKVKRLVNYNKKRKFEFL